MQAILDSSARIQKLQTHLPWLEILALVLQQQSSGETLAGFPLLGKSSKLDETISEALRYVFGHILRHRVFLQVYTCRKVVVELPFAPWISCLLHPTTLPIATCACISPLPVWQHGRRWLYLMCADPCGPPRLK